MVDTCRKQSWLYAQVCRECDVLLAFDETVTGFRMAWGGGHVYYGVTPDLVTYGKVIGGGMPIGCVGGRASIMRRFGSALNGLFPLAENALAAAEDAPIAAGGKAESVGVFGAIGTFNGFPLALASGLATLRVLQRRKEHVYPWLEATNRRIVRGSPRNLHQLRWQLRQELSFDPTEPLLCSGCCCVFWVAGSRSERRMHRPRL